VTQLENSGDKATVNTDGTLNSEFMSSAEQMQAQLGPSLCLAKWQQTSLHLTTGHTNSCYHPPLHRIDADDLQDNPSALHNTSHKKSERVQMLQGQKPQGCSYCWKVEATGNLSDRHYRSGEPWAAEAYTDITTKDPLTWDVIPSYVEVNFNSACNLRCSYCSPQFSSTWAKEIKEYGAYPTSNRHNDPQYFAGDRKPIPVRDHNPYVEAFWRWWPDLYPKLKHFRMTGGEPLMDKNTFRVLDYVIANPKPDLHLNVTSNFSVEDHLMLKYINKVQKICDTGAVEHFMQFVSVDSAYEQADYIRHGLDYDHMITNVGQFLSDVDKRSSITFIITMNNLSIGGLQNLLDTILKLRQEFSTDYQRVWFDTPILRSPAWQCLDIMPEAYAWKLQQITDWMRQTPETQTRRFQGFKDYEIQRLQRVVDWMRAEYKEDITAQADFYRFFAEHDRRRNTNFLQTFPEMSEWWDQCKYRADNV
jgi:MoaA/NifB/PqqE/SkfB family radical SAM enzyme